MSEGAGDETPSTDKRHVGGELVIPIAGLAFTIYYFSTILDSPWTAQVSAFFVGAILIALITAFLIKTVAAYMAGEVDFAPGPLAEPLSFLPKRVALLGLTVGYIIVIHYLGFTITTFLFMAASMLLLSNGRNIAFILGLSLVVSVAGWALFILAFETRFPVGPFEALMNTLI